MNFGELARKLSGYLDIDAGEARRRINVAYVDEAQAHCWGHLIKQFTLQTEAAYATGTIAVTNGATGVTLTGGAWSVAWTTTPSMRKIAIQGRFEPYAITITGANTGTLADPWIGETLTAASYNMWRDRFPLPTDCGYSRLMALYDPLLRFKLSNKNQSIFLRERGLQPQLVNIPGLIMIVNQTTEQPPRAQFDMWPGPATVRAYHGWYFRRPAFMTSDAEYPDWPAEFQDMLPLSAAIQHYSTPRFYSPKYLNLYKPTYADMYGRMVKAMDGDAALDLVIEDAFTGSRSWTASNAHWSPDVLGFVGSEMTRS